ncbi:MAG: hypothetical protein NXI00_10830 [Cytophagales bacterium]|nr:hypothetical protein [Cytophagales bacterium]
MVLKIMERIELTPEESQVWNCLFDENSLPLTLRAMKEVLDIALWGLKADPSSFSPDTLIKFLNLISWLEDMNDCHLREASEIVRNILPPDRRFILPTDD